MTRYVTGHGGEHAAPAPQLAFGRASAAKMASCDIGGQAVRLAEIIPPPCFTLPATALAAPKTPAATQLPADMPMKIHAQHVVGEVTRVKHPSWPVKKLPLWPCPDESAWEFDRLRPVWQPVPELLLQGPPPSVLRY